MRRKWTYICHIIKDKPDAEQANQVESINQLGLIHWLWLHGREREIEYLRACGNCLLEEIIRCRGVLAIVSCEGSNHATYQG